MLTVKQVAESLSVSATCVYQLIAQGKLACHRIGIGRGAIRVSREDLTEFVNGCRREERREEPLSLPSTGRQSRFKHLRLEG